MKYVEELMQKELSRKEFLALVGAGVVSVFGFSQILKALLEQKPAGRQQTTAAVGYGGSAYGGEKR